MGFRRKQIAGLTLVAATVALATSLVNMTALVRFSVAETESRARLLAETLRHQASRVIRQNEPEELRSALAWDAALNNYAEGVVGYSATTMYVAMTDLDGFALVHSNPLELGDKLTPAPSLESFVAKNPLAQLWALRQGHSVLEVAMPFDDDDGERFGAVHVAISTLFLKEEIWGVVTQNVLLASTAVVAAFLASLLFANWLWAPIELLRRELGRFQPVDGEPPLDLQSEADVSRIAEFFASMSQRLDEERSARENDASWLSAMLGGLSDAVLVVSNDGRVLSLNERAADLLGLGREELQGKLFADFFPEEHPVAEIVTKALSLHEPVGPVDTTITNGKRPVVYALSAQVLRDESGVSGVIVSARDMEKLSRLGSQLSYAQKLAALGKLTSGVAHEIKNPLNAMVIHVALLRERLARASPETQASLDTLEKEIRRLDQVIQGFLRFTRPEDLQFTSVSLRELFDEVERLVSAEAKASGIEIETGVSEELPAVHGDRELLQQLFLNLVRNAEEAMPHGGQLHVEAARTEDGVEIVIADSGVGIEPEMLEKIFDLYVTTKKKGSGIGLSMVYRIVQLHGGEIKVESQTGDGTRFTIHLPEMPA